MDLIIITEKPITYESVFNAAEKGLSDLIIMADCSELFSMWKDDEGFELEFSPNDRLNDPDSLMDHDVIVKCPKKDAYLTNLGYTSVEMAKKIIELLKPLFGEMWIQSDESDDWFGTADEFIQNYNQQ